MYILYILGFVTALILLWKVLPALLGKTLDMNVTGKAYLKSQLKKLGINGILSNECLSEIANISVRRAESLAKWTKEGVHTELVNSIEFHSMFAFQWIKTNESLDEPGYEEIVGIMKKHKVERSLTKQQIAPL